MHDFAALFRRRFIRELWRRLGRDLADRPIAIYGAGPHTRWLLDAINDVEGGPRLAAIIDDQADGHTMAGLRVQRRDEVDPAGLGAVLISCDEREAALGAEARSWIEASAPGERPMVIEPYRGLPPGPYPVETQTKPRPETPAAAPVGVVRMLPAQREESAYERAHGLGTSIPVPGCERRRACEPKSDADYITTGRAEREAIGRICAQHGIELESARDILEWGCSTGRVLRHFADLPDQARLWGCDTDEDAIEWAQRHFEGRFRFFSTTNEPRLPLSVSAFDFIYGIGPFTRICRHVDTWLMELRRLIRPGGAVLVTIRDEKAWDYCRDHPHSPVAKACSGFDFEKPLEHDFVAQGEGDSCQAFWHTRGVRRRWSHAFEVAGIHPLTFCGGTQAGVVLRPRM